MTRGDGAGNDAAAPSAARDMFDRDLASRSLGIELVSAGHGAAVARMRVTAEMVNGHGMTHGGYVFLLADTTFALACNAAGPVTVAAGADITFLRPTTAGDELEARAAERASSGRSGVYDVTVTRAGEVVAEFRGRSRTIGPGDTSSGQAGSGQAGFGKAGSGKAGAGAANSAEANLGEASPGRVSGPGAAVSPGRPA